MQSVWICILAGRPFGETFKNIQWKKSNKCDRCDFASSLGRQFEVTLENTRWRKVKQMQPVQFCTLSGRTHLKIHCGEKFNRCILAGNVLGVFSPSVSVIYIWNEKYLDHKFKIFRISWFSRISREFLRNFTSRSRSRGIFISLFTLDLDL